MSISIDPKFMSLFDDNFDALIASAQSPGAPWQEEYAYSLGVQAYIWGFPWIYLTQICWLWTSASGQAVAQASGKKMPHAPMNSFHSVQKPVTPATSDGGSPNCDTLYSTAWLDLSREPLILSVPAVTDRFYSFEMASISSDNFAYIGVVSTGNAAGNYLIAGAGFSGTVPGDVMDVLPRCPTPIAFLLGRTGLNDDTDTDLEAAHSVQNGYALTPLSQFKHAGVPAAPAPHAQVPVGINIDKPEGSFLTMNRAMTQSPPGVYPALEQGPLLNLFATIGVGPGQRLEAQSAATLRGLRRAARDGMSLLKQMSYGRGKLVNQWTYPPLDLGRAGQNSDYITRAALQALAGIVANDPNQAVYLNTTTDSSGQLFSGAGRYQLVFDATGDGFPPIVPGFFGFWSITLYDNTYNLVPGSTAYTINSRNPKYQPLQPNGNMTILLQSDPPDTLGDGVYWLQTPAPSTRTTAEKDSSDAIGDFMLILRVYVPGPSLSGSQTWVPPKVVRIQ